MECTFFDDLSIRERLKPFTYTRPAALLRVGIMTIAEKWSYYPGSMDGNTDYSFYCPDYLQEKFTPPPNGSRLFINGTVIPEPALVQAITSLKPNEGLFYDDKLIAGHFRGNRLPTPEELTSGEIFSKTTFPDEVTLLQNNWDIFVKTPLEIKKDYALITRNRISAPLEDPYTRVYNRDKVFIEQGAIVRASVINAEEGPVYIGKNTHIQEGALIRGPFALCQGGQVAMGAKIRGGTTIGPWSKGGGEINNAVIMGYSNKGHEGFIGNSVIGEWCNIGADTNTSNLKNNYGNVKIWDFTHRNYQDTGRQFIGLLMGDHSKCGINTMFNTGTITGVNVNIFNAGFPPKYIPSFSWGGAKGLSVFEFSRAMEVAENVMQRKNLKLHEADRKLMQYLYDNRNIV